MGAFDSLPPQRKKKLIEAWKNMSQEDKAHFRNQIALALVLMGNTKTSKKTIAKILDYMIDHTNNLSEFGHWFNKYMSKISRKPKNASKAGIMLEAYRMKYALGD